MSTQNSQAPMLPSPLGKPSITTRSSAKSMGSFEAHPTAGTEYKQACFMSKSMGAGAKPDGKSAAWSTGCLGTEYGQVSSK